MTRLAAPRARTEFDARTWAQFFLEYVVSHPAVTVARASTTQAKHMLDNVGGGIGRLPNETTRKRMAPEIGASLVVQSKHRPLFRQAPQTSTRKIE